MNGHELNVTVILQADFTVVYHLTSFERNEDIRIKVALKTEDLNIPSISNVWESANWYEREVFDMFGINFSGHPETHKNTDARIVEGTSAEKRTPHQGYRYGSVCSD